MDEQEWIYIPQVAEAATQTSIEPPSAGPGVAAAPATAGWTNTLATAAIGSALAVGGALAVRRWTAPQPRGPPAASMPSVAAPERLASEARLGSLVAQPAAEQAALAPRRPSETEQPQKSPLGKGPEVLLGELSMQAEHFWQRSSVPALGLGLGCAALLSVGILSRQPRQATLHRIVANPTSATRPISAIGVGPGQEVQRVERCAEFLAPMAGSMWAASQEAVGNLEKTRKAPQGAPALSRSNSDVPLQPRASAHDSAEEIVRRHSDPRSLPAAGPRHSLPSDAKIADVDISILSQSARWTHQGHRAEVHVVNGVVRSQRSPTASASRIFRVLPRQ